MKKFIALTAVSYDELNDGKICAEEHKIVLDINFIHGFTDWVLPSDDFNLEDISKETYKCDGSKVILTKEGKEFFNKHFFSLEKCNGIDSLGLVPVDDYVLVTEELDEIKKMLWGNND
ncbi:hypothetical protein [Glaesserella parasuis]|uniref:hypothetical protein n=1 Tax=Glaesserella parasuis TaxID=738 RepID=UPI0021BD0FC6|nr:hypothetical protein [Glaesserella parasuis]MCT8830296.1 hypothetical protein [Glaesserella parasuis]MCT8834571.1 hypothetical protein [Glaesserella parasuis]MDG6450329.1 hypothetical protein [Glaesserella parasuis]MDO9656555.1 hypothetical protein [Glaesserella parasuis]MDO9716237.1 hypothetical protein [Glaesserella parasuis]